MVLKEDQVLDLKIEALGSKGDGVARHEGMIIFVADTVVGDEVRVKITKVLPKVAFGQRV